VVVSVNDSMAAACMMILEPVPAALLVLVVSMVIALLVLQ